MRQLYRELRVLFEPVGEWSVCQRLCLKHLGMLVDVHYSQMGLLYGAVNKSHGYDREAVGSISRWRKRERQRVRCRDAVSMEDHRGYFPHRVDEEVLEVSCGIARLAQV